MNSKPYPFSQTESEDLHLHPKQGKRISRLLYYIFPLVLLSFSLFAGILWIQVKAHAAATDPVNLTADYAINHWNWGHYNNSNPTDFVTAGKSQPQFQCSEFVARSIAAAGPLGNLTPDISGFERLEYPTGSGTFYNLKYAGDLYNFLINSGAGIDVGSTPNAQSLTLGSVVIFGTATEDFEHVAIVTKATDANNIFLTQHNLAEQSVPSSELPSYLNGQGVSMPPTHIVQVNYNAIANGALVSGQTIFSRVKMLAPAPYYNRIVNSGITLAWQPVTGASGYEVGIFDVNGHFVAGVSTLGTSFSLDLSTVPYGNYNYTIQPVSTTASFGIFYDTFNYEPNTCTAKCQSASGVLPSFTGIKSAIVKLSVNGADACKATSLGPNDDGSSAAVPLPFTANFFGVTYSSVFVNNNGNVSFDAPLSDYTPYPLSSTIHAIIAPYFTDVDTRATGSGSVTYGIGTYQKHQTFCVDWTSVGYFGNHIDKLNSFQLLLVDRSDRKPGDFDIVMNYNTIQWETGDASGGSQGYGGTSARVGYTNGIGTFFELPNSSVNSALLDSSPTGLIYASQNSAQLGRYVFIVKNTGASRSGVRRAPSPFKPKP